jgi:hypothetical protein
MESKRKFVQIVPVALIAIVVFTIVITSTALAANWDGTWYNKDTATKGMVKFTIKDETFHGYGSCTPTPCDWGTAPLIFYSKSVTDTNNVAAIA